MKARASAHATWSRCSGFAVTTRKGPVALVLGVEDSAEAAMYSDGAASVAVPPQSMPAGATRLCPPRMERAAEGSRSGDGMRPARHLPDTVVTT